MLKVTVNILRRIPRTTKYQLAGFSSTPCEVETCYGEARGMKPGERIVRLLAPGAGYPQGHLLRCDVRDLSEK